MAITRTVKVHGLPITLHLRKHSAANHNYIVDYRLPGPQNIRRRISTRTTDLELAKTFLEILIDTELPADVHNALQTVSANPHLTSRDPRIRDITDYYVRSYLPAKNRSQKTIEKADHVLRQLETYSADHHIGRLSQLSGRHIEAYAHQLRERGRSPKTIHNHIGLIRAAINIAITAGLAETSPVDQWLMPSIPERPHSGLDLDELRTVLHIVQEHIPHDFPIVEWLTHTGQRYGDVRDLRFRQIHWPTLTVERTQTKTGRIIRYAFPERLKTSLETLDHFNDSPDAHVFRNRWGRPYSPNELYKRFTRALRTAQYPRHVRIHDLRHSYASILINELSAPVTVVQNQLGHADLKTTLRYVKNKDARPYAEALDQAINGQCPDTQTPTP